MLKAVISITLRNLGLIQELQAVGSKIHGILEDLKQTLEKLEELALNGYKAWVAGKFDARWVEGVKRSCYRVDELLGEWEVNHINGGGHRQSCLLSWCCFGCDDISSMIFSKLKQLHDNLLLLTIEASSTGITAEKGKEPFDSCRLTSSLFDPAMVVGREVEKRALVDTLVKQQNEAVHQQSGLDIVSIVGYVGIGKTMLAKLVYSDEAIVEHFEFRFWVCVSDKFDEMAIAKSIISQLPGECDCRDKHVTTLLEYLSRRIAGKRFLLVIDHVREECPNKWKSIIAALQRGSKQSRVLVTTRDYRATDSLNSYSKNQRIFRLAKLSQDDCWELFGRYAFAPPGGNDERCGDWDCHVKAVVKRCRGVPRIAEKLGLIVRYERLLGIGFSASDLWGHDRTLDLLWPTYFDLPPATGLCFAYCAVLPSGFQIPDDKLIRLWMAQGYLDLESSNHHEDPEVVGERYIQDLLMRSLLRVVVKTSADDQGDHSNKGVCRVLEMPEAIHDFARVCAAAECISVQDPDHHDIPPEAFRFVDELSVPLHLSIVPSDDVSSSQESSVCIVPRHEPSKHLLSLLVQSKTSLDDIEISQTLSSLFTQLTLLKSLDLTDCSFRELPSTIGDLVLLRLLILSGNKDLEELPEEICALSKLQTLEANWCEGLNMLPTEIGNLVSLRHLGYLLMSRKAYLPRGIRRLTRLRTLTTFNVARRDDESASLADLGNLNELRGKLCINGLGDLDVAADVSEAREARLHEKKGISALELNFQREVEEEESQANNDEFILEALQPQPDLVELTVKGYKGRRPIFPSWLVTLRSLRKISLLLCDACESFPPLGKLACLEELDICYMPRVTTVGREFLGTEVDDGLLAAESSSPSSSSSVVTAAFPMLTKLTIRNMLSWTEWKDDWSETAVVFAKLRTLSLGVCPNLKALPEKLLRSTCLEEVELLMCPLLEKRYVVRANVAHILKIKEQAQRAHEIEMANSESVSGGVACS